VAAVRRLHGQALRIVKSEERLYSCMILREYSRLFNKWRAAANRYFETPDILETVTEELLVEHFGKIFEIYRTNNVRVMRSVHKFQMNFLDIKESDSLYSRTKALIQPAASSQARTANGETANRTTTILNIANRMAAEDAIPKDAIAYAFERLKGDMGTRRANTIAGDQAHRAGNNIIQAIGDLMQQGGVKSWKMWMSRRDSKVRAAHRRADGQTVQSNETFTVDGESLRFPGDPNGSPRNVINCRCFSVVKRRPGKKVKRRAA